MATNKRDTHERSELYMDTIITIKVVTSHSREKVDQILENAFKAFQFVENVCSRFNEESEVSQLSQHIGTPVQVSNVLFEVVQFALVVADLTKGAFDPTLGKTLEKNGFNLNYRTGHSITSKIDFNQKTNYSDVVLNQDNRTILLKKPLLLDLGAIAKGLAVDLAVKELQRFDGFMINAGGDIFASGINEWDEAWCVGIQHPAKRDEIIGKLIIHDAAVCTSGSYERVSPLDKDSHHLINPVSGKSQTELLSLTVVAPYTMMADALSTAAFILGKEKGLEFLEKLGVNGLLVTSSLETYMTKEMRDYIDE